MSYQNTSMSSSVIINQATIIFVYMISLFTLKKPFNIRKLLAVIVCIESVAIISLTDHEDHNAKDNNVVGNLLALIDTVFYAIYGVLIYVLLPPEK